jgi:DNA modification methylase
MSQKYKNVYFADFPARETKKKNFTLAFGDKHQQLYESIKPLSSQEMRERLGYQSFILLRKDAENDGLSVNTFCLRLLKKKNSVAAEPIVQYHLPNLPLPANPFSSTHLFTFKGGQHEPLHEWYPLLEGYSPQFVEEIIENFSPNASVILDPFSGSGTTPLTVVRSGKIAYYCELNPLFQYITEIKARTLSFDQHKRSEMSRSLKAITNSLEDSIEKYPEDRFLRDSYQQTFGASKFFEAETLVHVLKARSYIDSLACADKTLADFVTISVLASLIPGSRLIRRGDIRYKKEDELVRYRVNFIDSVVRQILLIARDLERLTVSYKPPRLLCENASELYKLPHLNIDTVITSPPYLNGTNYFRNTKLELWFLRALKTATDLSTFRFKAVTAGINDVTVRDTNDELIDEIKNVITLVAEKAYDRRIPQMIAYYFQDMRAIFKAIAHHLCDNAVVAIDIGDSIYGGIHVRTDRLLVKMLEAEGYSFEKDITLRKRISRNGSTLRQVLLIFKYKKPSRSLSLHTKPKTNWQSSWDKFKLDLPHQRGDFAKRNWGNPLHSLCSYQGKMKPSLAAHLVRTFVPSGGVVLDPFAGVGTIPFEAALQGMKSWAFEISPAALTITMAKLGKPNRSTCLNAIKALETFIKISQPTREEIQKAHEIKFNGVLNEYFDQRTFAEILLARRYFSEHQPQNSSEAMVLSSLLHVLHGNRPYALSRRSHPITPFAPTGAYQYRPLIPRLTEKVLRSLDVEYPETYVEGQALFQDATTWWDQKIDALDTIITSPPFFDSTRFYLANWMRLWFCGWEADDFKSKPLSFVDERQKKDFDVYSTVFRQGRERLKTTGVMVLHLGKSRKCDMAKELSRIAKRWFNIADLYTESVRHIESHGIRDKGTVTSHQYLVLY